MIQFLEIHVVLVLLPLQSAVLAIVVLRLLLLFALSAAAYGLQAFCPSLHSRCSAQFLARLTERAGT